MKNKPFLLALNHIAGIGPRTVKILLQQWPDLEKLFSLSPADMRDVGLPTKIAEAINRFSLEKIKEDLAWEQQKETHHILTWEDDAYPALLREIYDPPIVLYAQGDLSCLQKTCIAMVGTRHPSATGRETARRFARVLAKNDIVVVSGLALGIDAEAHAGCLDVNGPTVAVMGTGINRLYPYRNRDLASKIKKNGLIMSEFSLNTPPAPGHFPQRNRIISGLTLATLVVEAAIRSGSLITARMAVEQNREVMAIPGSIHNPQSKGCHYLLQQGAKLVASVADVMQELGLNCSDQNITNNPKDVATEEKNLVNCLGFEMTTLDQIIYRSGLNLEETASCLADLELKGLVKAVPGGYMRCI